MCFLLILPPLPSDACGEFQVGARGRPGLLHDAVKQHHRRGADAEHTGLLSLARAANPARPTRESVDPVKFHWAVRMSLPTTVETVPIRYRRQDSRGPDPSPQCLHDRGGFSRVREDSRGLALAEKPAYSPRVGWEKGVPS